MHAAYLWNNQGNIPRVNSWTYSTIASDQSLMMASQADPVTKEGKRRKKKKEKKKKKRKKK